MAGLAQRLGRSFEARAFLTIELAQDPARDDLRAELERLKAEEGKKATWKGTLANRVEHDRMRD